GGLAGAIVATFFVFLPSFVFVLGGAHYVEKVQDSAAIQAFLAGVSAAVVGVIAVVSLELAPEAITGWPSVLLAVAAFLSIVWLKRDVALVAICGIVGGVMYAVVTHQ
ncbi:MAG TPA: chromate transporter, partial [Pyrinomonadaceae bacterium]|nr:chromate transporter [Pyrinomonadaceae bacterium]